MTSSRFVLLMSVPILFLTTSASAHDPSEHMKDTKKPDCAAMKDMDHGKMAMSDPVMQAMMQKCMNHMPKNNAATDAHNEHEHKK